MEDSYLREGGQKSHGERRPQRVLLGTQVSDERHLEGASTGTRLPANSTRRLMHDDSATPERLREREGGSLVEDDEAIREGKRLLRFRVGVNVAVEVRPREREGDRFLGMKRARPEDGGSRSTSMQRHEEIVRLVRELARDARLVAQTRQDALPPQSRDTVAESRPGRGRTDQEDSQGGEGYSGARQMKPLADLALDLGDARARSLALTLDLDDARWLGPRLATVNPLLWEMGHLGWFQEYWVLRHARREAPILGNGDALYDSAKVPHDTRWDLPLPDRGAVLAYLREVLERTVRSAREEERYFLALALFHEDMHGEAFAMTRQSLGYPAPPLEATPVPRGGALPGDVAVPGGEFVLGAREGGGFVFDNEKWGHQAPIDAFRIARAPVTNRDYGAFVEAGGYDDRGCWSDEGWRWRCASSASQPVHWTRTKDGWSSRRYHAHAPLAPDEPVTHLSWFEAEAFCRRAGRRLPTEAEWELAASGYEKRTYPWGETPPHAGLANVDARAGGPADVGSFAAGDSPFGCRQMLGNVWEWTASDFAPYRGFVVDPYAEYSAPWFHGHKVLRGGSWATRGRLLRNTFRNFYTPDRRDVFAGFRTCAVEELST